MDFEECMEFIGAYSHSGEPVTDLSRAEGLMERIGNPEKRLKFIHIAGTNGKGSTLEYIANALELSGYRTGCFTSPFVTHYTDRIRINGREIDERSLGEICTYLKEQIDDRAYSQFEISMAAAMLWYEREKCDIVVLEAGIGGLLDCTNVIPPPLMSVITSVSLDHTAILGDTAEKIAQQKAGIIKRESAVVLSAGNKETVEEIIRRKAESVGAEFILSDESSLIVDHEEPCGVHFSYKGRPYKTSMAGAHQAVNAVTAIEVCKKLRTLGYEISDENISKAVETTQVRARQQYIDGNPPVIVDGGHNPDGVDALAHTLKNIRYVMGKKIYAVMGMVNTKDYMSSIEKVAALSDRMFTVDGFAYNSVSASVLAEAASAYTEAETSTLVEAVKNAKKLAKENDGIAVICGSLYLASEYLNAPNK